MLWKWHGLALAQCCGSLERSGDGASVRAFSARKAALESARFAGSVLCLPGRPIPNGSPSWRAVSVAAGAAPAAIAGAAL
eukprot:4663899-Alexandrium_andersonii.AAC.1